MTPELRALWHRYHNEHAILSAMADRLPTPDRDRHALALDAAEQDLDTAVLALANYDPGKAYDLARQFAPHHHYPVHILARATKLASYEI